MDSLAPRPRARAPGGNVPMHSLGGGCKSPGGRGSTRRLDPQDCPKPCQGKVQDLMFPQRGEEPKI